MNKYRNYIFGALVALIVGISGCGGGSSSGGGVTTSSERDGSGCLLIGNATSASSIMLTNRCDTNIIVRILTGGTGDPATIAANSSINYHVNGLDSFVEFGSCIAPFTPVNQGDGFDCQ